MQKLDFLKDVLPSGTRYSLRLISKSAPVNKFFDSLEDLVEYTENRVGSGVNVYYSTAGFGSGEQAAESNATAKKSFYIDVDCGEKKPYLTKEEGAVALRKFVTELSLPRPVVVDSGTGLHAYWVLDAAVAVHVWKPVAEKLKAVCRELEFSVDHSCTADVVRILRVPGTINQKNGATVTVLTPMRFCAFEAFKQAIGADAAIEEDFLRQAQKLTRSSADMSETAKLIASNKTSKFEIIWNRSVKGDGCAQIKYAIDNADSLAEPVWRAALSVANFCEDREWGIHEISKDYPAYDPQETEAKAIATRGPYTCETFQKSDTSNLCIGCKYLGKIKSPIQLGSYIKEAAPEDNKAIVNTDAGQTEYEIPSYPWPFFRGTSGGIYKYTQDKDESGETKQAVVYPHDLYAYKRMHDVEHGDVIFMRLHLPRDGVRTFTLKQTDVAAKDRLRDEINKNGVALVSATKLQDFQFFLASQIEELQFKEKADVMSARYGWTDDNTFVIGDREYTRKGVKYTSKGNSLSNINRALTMRGDLNVWKEIAAAYERPAFDMHALGVLAGFGSVLMRISPEHGGVLNYYSKASGTGKTTILKLANSIWGNPSGLLLNVADTALSKVNRMGLLNGIVITLDEMTNAHPEEISALAYGSTQGRARNRMRARENLERENNMTWDTISVWSSNASLEDRLTLMKLDPQGEMARLLEIHLKTPVPSDVLEAQQLFNQLNDNYGVAGDVFMRYVIPNLDEVRDIWLQVRDKIYGMEKWSQTERYRLNLLVCMIAAGIIAKSLGLLNYDMKRLALRGTALVKQGVERMRESSSSAAESIAMFVNENVNSMLIIKNNASVGTLNEVPIKIPNRGQLILRYEPDTRALYIGLREFNKWCAMNQINSREVRANFKSETGSEMHVVKKRMGKGWDTDFGPVSAYEIHNAIKVLGLDESELEAPTSGA